MKFGEIAGLPPELAQKLRRYASHEPLPPRKHYEPPSAVSLLEGVGGLSGPGSQPETSRGIGSENLAGEHSAEAR